MADVDGTAGGWGDAPPLAGGRGPKREGERHKLSASAAGQAWEHTLLLLTPIFTCRVGGYASVAHDGLTNLEIQIVGRRHNTRHRPLRCPTTPCGRDERTCCARP